MIPLYTPTEFSKSKIQDILPCKCYVCNKTFYIQKKQIVAHLRGSKDKCMYCSQKCSQSTKIRKQKVHCTQCNSEFEKLNKEIKKTKKHFCSKSCAATYNNTHKQHGARRSKLEIYLEKQLTSLYPNLQIDFNKKDTINSELDIYIPSLKLAFELNGIYHYEPIYGPEKLLQTQNNDQRKFQACIEQGISLCIIDTSKQKYFKESTSKEFLNIITDIINNKSKN